MGILIILLLLAVLAVPIAAIIEDNKENIQNFLAGMFIACIVFTLIIGTIIAITC